ncbi:MAG TPA: hypothetical protein VJZ91_12510, partial [Blastocatellia bacterium]|nr:hypothetical protein [Blastocatellia bacterium]
MDRKRLLLALVLSVAVLMGYSLVMNRFFPSMPPLEPGPASSDASNPKPQVTPPAPPPSTTAPAPVPSALATPVPPRDVVVDTPYWDVTLSNRGAVATSWILKAYPEKGALKQLEGAAGGPLQLIPQPLPEGLNAPLALFLPGQPDLTTQLNGMTYQVKVDGADVSESRIHINPGEARKITFTSSNGAAVKEFMFYGDRLVFDAKAGVTGGEQPAQIVVGSGFGDQSDKAVGSYNTPP